MARFIRLRRRFDEERADPGADLHGGARLRGRAGVRSGKTGGRHARCRHGFRRVDSRPGGRTFRRADVHLPDARGAREGERAPGSSADFFPAHDVPRREDPDDGDREEHFLGYELGFLHRRQDHGHRRLLRRIQRQQLCEDSRRVHRHDRHGSPGRPDATFPRPRHRYLGGIGRREHFGDSRRGLQAVHRAHRRNGLLRRLHGSPARPRGLLRVAQRRHVRRNTHPVRVLLEARRRRRLRPPVDRERGVTGSCRSRERLGPRALRSPVGSRQPRSLVRLVGRRKRRQVRVDVQRPRRSRARAARTNWKLQGEWSNAAYTAGTGYPNSSGQKGCLDGH